MEINRRRALLLAGAPLAINACRREAEVSEAESAKQQGAAAVHRSQEPTTVGTLGHIDHGKTVLAAAITKVLAKQNPSVQVRPYDSIHNTPTEKNNGVSMSVARVHYQYHGRQFLHLDCRGHLDHMKNMILGSKIDGAILVVAATDGPMPQTREHILTARHAGVRSIVVALNKVDLVSDHELLDLVEMEARELLTSYGFAGDKVPVIRVSGLGALNGDARWVKSVESLMDAVEGQIPMPKVTAGPGSVRPIRKFKGAVYVLSGDEGGRRAPLFDGYRAEFYFDDLHVNGVAKLSAGTEMAMPGDIVDLEIELRAPMAVPIASRFVIRQADRVIGAGLVAEILG